MAVDLPQPIAAFFAADRLDGKAVAECFTENAVVKDERHSHAGRADIAQWKAEATAKYAYTAEPIASAERDGKTVVTCRVAGNFPGSPIELRYFFRLERGKIAALEIIP